MGRPVQQEFIDRINEIIEQVNKLAECHYEPCGVLKGYEDSVAFREKDRYL